MCAFSPRRTGTLSPEKCLSGREDYDEKDILSPLRPAAGAGHAPADRRLPADTGSVRPGTGGFFRSPAGHCGFGSRPGQRRRAALRSGQRELSAGRPERRSRGLGAPAGLSDRGCGSGNDNMTQLSQKGADIMNSSDEEQDTDVEPLKTKTQLPEDGIITQAQMETIAGKDEKFYFVGKTDSGIGYKWTYNGSQIQNPVEQKLLVQCTEDGTEEIKKAANNAPYALKVTLEKMNLAAPAKLTLNLKEEWNADKVLYCLEENGKIYQKNIRGNHVALVQAGRAGNQVKIYDEKKVIPEKYRSIKLLEKAIKNIKII